MFVTCAAVKNGIFCCSVRLVCSVRTRQKNRWKGSYSHLLLCIFSFQHSLVKAPTQFPFSLAGAVTAPLPVGVCFRSSLHLWCYWEAFQHMKHLQMFWGERQILLELDLLMLVGPFHLDSVISQLFQWMVFIIFFNERVRKIWPKCLQEFRIVFLLRKLWVVSDLQNVEVLPFAHWSVILRKVGIILPKYL